MPLKKGTSKRVFEQNYLTEIRHGRSVKQALAIAYSVQRKSKR